MPKNTRSDGRTGLLEDEEASRLFRSKFNAEIPHIPNPVLDEPITREAETQFLRSQRRVPVRRRGGSRFFSRFGFGSRWIRLLRLFVVLAVCGLIAMAGLTVKAFLFQNRHFILQSTEGIQVSGNRVVTRSQATAFFEPDVSHSIFRMPLAHRKAQLEGIKWVRSATVMRLWPNQIRVNLVERTPVAFALDGYTVRLVDDQGILLDLPDAASQHYSFPVLTGITSADPLPIRAARIAMYLQFIHALDAQGGRISSTLSQVDLSDPEDVRAIFLGAVRQPLVHFGDSDYLARYLAYQAHLREWLQQYPALRSVDMRYGKQVVLDTGSVPDSSSAPLDDSTGATGLAPDSGTTARFSATVSPASSNNATSRSVTHTAASAHSRSTHHNSTTHNAHHTPERGHTVKHPLMHVVSGM
ncbi:MAG TPA: FtsQ-type POTRA domain-containing protein [Acidobacteriaceae bacterium]|nr:FtsQ-type POTRA domain-containing protein [Acidobacteriaceae bacterium]